MPDRKLTIVKRAMQLAVDWFAESLTKNKMEVWMEGKGGLWRPKEFEEWARYYDPSDVFRDINARFK
jgi:hypothetical protein